MKTFRVIERRHGPPGDLRGFRGLVARNCRGDIKARPGDCSGRRFLVRDGCEAQFETLAERFGLSTEADARAAFPNRAAAPSFAGSRPR